MNNYYAIAKVTGEVFKLRMTVKRFKHADEMHKFLNSQYDNNWKDISEKHEAFKAGVYAFVGQRWQNVKSLDSSVLAHV